jgi:hypothetical protein
VVVLPSLLRKPDFHFTRRWTEQIIAAVAELRISKRQTVAHMHDIKGIEPQ